MVDTITREETNIPSAKSLEVERKVRRDTQSSERWVVPVSDQRAILVMMATILLSPVVYDLVELIK